MIEKRRYHEMGAFDPQLCKLVSNNLSSYHWEHKQMQFYLEVHIIGFVYFTIS